MHKILNCVYYENSAPRVVHTERVSLTPIDSSYGYVVFIFGTIFKPFSVTTANAIRLYFGRFIYVPLRVFIA